MNDSNTVKGIAKEFFVLVIGIEVNILMLRVLCLTDRTNELDRGWIIRKSKDIKDYMEITIKCYIIVSFSWWIILIRV